VQAFYGRNAGHSPWGRRAKDWRDLDRRRSYTGLKTAADPSLACAQPTLPSDRHGTRHFTRASLDRACSSPGEGGGGVAIGKEGYDLIKLPRLIGATA